MKVEAPLEGVRVLDFTRILSGPYCSLFLSDLGADVIKIERPGVGDDTRAWGPPFLDEREGISSYFAAMNRGKRSIALDLGDQANQVKLVRLVATADMVIENFRPGVAQRHGIDHESLLSMNPRIVSCSISGFGHEGDFANLPGTEIVVEAMTGLMSVTGPQDGEPVRFGIAMTDICTGLTAAVRMLAALRLAEKTGVGSHIDVSLFSVGLASLSTLITATSATSQDAQRWGSHHPSIVPYGGFRTLDGSIITGVVNDSSWVRFCQTLGLVDLADDERYLSNAGRVRNRTYVEKRVAEALALRRTSEWVDLLQLQGLLAAPIRTVSQMLADPASHNTGLFLELDGYQGVLAPVLTGVPGHSNKMTKVPTLGEHSQQVLGEL